MTSLIALRLGQHLENSEARPHQEFRGILPGTVLLFNIVSHRTIESLALSLNRLSREIDFHVLLPNFFSVS